MSKKESSDTFKTFIAKFTDMTKEEQEIYRNLILGPELSEFLTELSKDHKVVLHNNVIKDADINSLLFKIGVHPNTKGFLYLSEIIGRIIRADKKDMENLETLYHIIGEEYNIPARNISRAVYTAVCGRSKMQSSVPEEVRREFSKQLSPCKFTYLVVNHLKALQEEGQLNKISNY